MLSSGGQHIGNTCLGFLPFKGIPAKTHDRHRSPTDQTSQHRHFCHTRFTPSRPVVDHHGTILELHAYLLNRGHPTSRLLVIFRGFFFFFSDRCNPSARFEGGLYGTVTVALE
jgi:hypothetical protein